jgi:hypothetical protein
VGGWVEKIMWETDILAPPLFSNYGQLLMGGALRLVLWPLLVHSIGIDLHAIPQIEKSDENGERMLPREN